MHKKYHIWLSIWRFVCYNCIKFMHFGEKGMKFNKLLKSLNKTQKSVAIELDERFGCCRTQAVVSQWFSGKILPDIQTVVYLSQILNISYKDIIDGILENRK